MPGDHWQQYNRPATVGPVCGPVNPETQASHPLMD